MSSPSDCQARTGRAINCTQSDRLRSGRAVPFLVGNAIRFNIHLESFEVDGQPVLARPKL